MEHNKIEILLEKYLEGKTSIAEGKELRDYFSTSNVAKHLEQHKSLFECFSEEKEQGVSPSPKSRDKKRTVVWLSIAASVVVLLGIGTYVYFNSNPSQNLNLGTYNDPEIAFKETQKALNLLSNHVNAGIESVHYVEEYQHSKNLIFKPY